MSPQEHTHEHSIYGIEYTCVRMQMNVMIYETDILSKHNLNVQIDAR